MTYPIPAARFPNAPRTVAKLLEQLSGNGRAGTRTPASLTGLMPYVRVTRIGGNSDEVSDYARIAIDVIGDNLTAIEDLSERIRQFLTQNKLRLGRAVIDRVTVDAAPQEVAPWASGIYRYEARYLVVSRRYRPA